MSYSLEQMNEMWCYRATVNTTEAVSPAFIIQGNNFLGQCAGDDLFFNLENRNKKAVKHIFIEKMQNQSFKS